MSADLAITNARIRTLDTSGSVAQAIAFSDQKIAAIGTDDDVTAVVGAGTRVLNGGGRTVIPAFTDSHTHFKRATIVRAFFIDFRDVLPTSVAEVVAAVKAKAESLPDGSWIQGDGLNDQALAERRFPVRQELDSVSGGRPVVLRSIGRHVVAANSLALKLAGIDSSTVSPTGGRIGLDENGEPTGVLHEQGKLRLDMTRADTVIPRFSDEERVRALAAGVAELHTYGIASIHEMAREADEIGDYLRLKEEGGLSARIRMHIRGIEADTRLEHVLALGLRSGLGDEWFRIAGVKFSIDGSGLARNAALYQPYPEQPDNVGVLRIEQEELNRAIELSHRAGLQIAVHAVGQRAADMAMDAYERVAADPAFKRMRHRVEHAYFPERPGQLRRMRDLGLMWSTQPAELYEVGDSWLEIFGAEWLEGAMPLRSGLDLGLVTQINSDYPVTSLDPFVSICAAVTRLTKAGQVIDSREAVSVDEALRAMTVTPAYVAHEEHAAGTLEAGKLADAIILSNDPYETATTELDQIEVRTTVVGGRVRFSKDFEEDSVG